MILFEVLWDNGLSYEDREQSTKTFSTLEKAQNYFDNYNGPRDYYEHSTLTLSSFDEDDIHQHKTKIAEKSIPCIIDLEEEFEIVDAKDDNFSYSTSDLEDLKRLMNK